MAHNAGAWNFGVSALPRMATLANINARKQNIRRSFRRLSVVATRAVSGRMTGMVEPALHQPPLGNQWRLYQPERTPRHGRFADNMAGLADGSAEKILGGKIGLLPGPNVDLKALRL